MLQPITETESDGFSLRSPSKQQALVLKQRRRTPPSGSGRKRRCWRVGLPSKPRPPEYELVAAPFSHHAVCSGERPCGGIVCPPSERTRRSSKACAAHRASRPLTTNSNVALSSRSRHHSAKCMMRNQACRINSRLEPTGQKRLPGPVGSPSKLNGAVVKRSCISSSVSGP